jgi:hypothetical protein
MGFKDRGNGHEELGTWYISKGRKHQSFNHVNVIQDTIHRKRDPKEKTTGLNEFRMLIIPFLAVSSIEVHEKVFLLFPGQAIIKGGGLESASLQYTDRIILSIFPLIQRHGKPHPPKLLIQKGKGRYRKV